MGPDLEAGLEFYVEAELEPAVGPDVEAGLEPDVAAGLAHAVESDVEAGREPDVAAGPRAPDRLDMFASIGTSPLSGFSPEGREEKP